MRFSTRESYYDPTWIDKAYKVNAWCSCPASPSISLLIFNSHTASQKIPYPEPHEYIPHLPTPKYYCCYVRFTDQHLLACTDSEQTSETM